jgi:acyl-homoserine lactone acylase PvdQ
LATAVRVRAEQLFTATQKSDKKLVKAKEKAELDVTVRMAKQRALRLVKEAADKETAGATAAEKAAAKNQKSGACDPGEAPAIRELIWSIQTDPARAAAIALREPTTDTGSTPRNEEFQQLRSHRAAPTVARSVTATPLEAWVMRHRMRDAVNCLPPGRHAVKRGDS